MSSLLLLVIQSQWVCFSPSTIMASYHHHRCWLFFVVVFICFLLADEFNHSLGSLVILEILCRSGHIIGIYHYFVFDLHQINCAVSHYLAFFPSAMALYHRCRGFSFFVYSSNMSATTCWYHWLHQKYFSEKSYYCYISLFHSRPLSAWLRGVTFSRNFIPA